MELIFQFIAECLFQFLFEAICELALYAFRNIPKEKRPALVTSTIGVLLSGAVIGGISVLLYPHPFIAKPDYRLLNLVAAPTVVGGAMLLIGKRRETRGQATVRLDQFGYAYAFAFAMALVRLFFAK